MTLIGTVCTGDKYDVRYVNNLYAMIRRNTTLPFRFHCITDKTDGFHKDISISEPHNDVWGWWHFMEYYAADMHEGDPKIYFGLDTVITGNIDKVLSRKSYTLSRDFNYLIENNNPLYLDTYADCAAVIPASSFDWLYRAFLREHITSRIGTMYHPMHVWVTKQLRARGIEPAIWQDLDADIMCSYKWPSPKKRKPKQPMVFFHGVPMVHDANHKWVRDNWHSRDL